MDDLNNFDYNSDGDSSNNSINGGRRGIELDREIDGYECEFDDGNVGDQFTSTPNRANRAPLDEPARPNPNSNHFLYQHNQPPSYSSISEQNEHDIKQIKALKQELAKERLKNSHLMLSNKEKDEKIDRLISAQNDLLQEFRRKLVIVAQEHESIVDKLKYKRSRLFKQ